MSNANRELIGYKKESTYGTNPGGNKQLLNFTSFNLAGSNESTQSNNVRADTNRTGTVRTGVDVSGDLGAELIYGAYDEFFEGVLRSTYPTAVSITSTGISAAASDNSFNSTAEFADLVAGQWIKVAGFVAANNNGYALIESKPSSSKIIVKGLTLTNESATPSITIKGTAIKNGTTQNSFTFERHFQDISNAFLLETGVRATNFSLNFATGAISTLSFGLMGKAETSPSSTGFSGSIAAVNNQSMNSINDVKKIIVAGTVYTGDLSQLEISVDTNAEKRMAIGSEFAQDIQQRSIAVSGNFSEYFEDTTILTKARNFEVFGLAFLVADEDGNAYGFNIPAIRLTGAKPDNGGLDQDIYIPYDYVAELSETYNASIIMTRIPA